MLGQMMKTPPNNHRGFTIIELMVTVLIAAVLLAVAVPSFIDTLERRRVVGAANELSADLQYARSLAVSKQLITTLENTSTSTYTITDSSGAGHKTVTLPPSLSFTVTGTVVFTTLNGTSNTETFTIASSRTDYLADVSTNLMGRVQLLCKTSGVGGLSSSSC
jgi:prepilin-type N-terminal cleavage/methylation domain-containing protein